MHRHIDATHAERRHISLSWGAIFHARVPDHPLISTIPHLPQALRWSIGSTVSKRYDYDMRKVTSPIRIERGCSYTAGHYHPSSFHKRSVISDKENTAQPKHRVTAMRSTLPALNTVQQVRDSECGRLWCKRQPSFREGTPGRSLLRRHPKYGVVEQKSCDTRELLKGNAVDCESRTTLPLLPLRPSFRPVRLSLHLIYYLDKQRLCFQELITLETQ